MFISGLFKHIALVTRHKWRVFVHCAKCGLIWRGIVHDASKFSPTELFESARYYQGNHSPISACRREKGYSYAWLHHKARNRHHLEYWVDEECKTPPPIPYKFAVECICDKLAATKTYRGKNYDPAQALWHFKTYGSDVNCDKRTIAFIEQALTDLRDHGEKYILNKKYMKENYNKFHSEPIKGEEENK